MRTLQTELRERDTTLLSTRQRADALQTRHTGDTERAEVRTVLLFCLSGAGGCER